MLHEFKRSVGFFPAFRINIFEYPRYYKLRISLYVCTFSKLVAWYIFREVKRAHSRRKSKFFIAYRSFQISLTHNYNYSQGLIPRSASLQAESKSITKAHFILLVFFTRKFSNCFNPQPPSPTSHMTDQYWILFRKLPIHSDLKDLQSFAYKAMSLYQKYLNLFVFPPKFCIQLVVLIFRNSKIRPRI